MSEPKKVRINLTDLKVKSFVTTPSLGRDAGTVRGMCDVTGDDTCTATNCEVCTTYTDCGGTGCVWTCGTGCSDCTDCTGCSQTGNGETGAPGGCQPCGITDTNCQVGCSLNTVHGECGTCTGCTCTGTDTIV